MVPFLPFPFLFKFPTHGFPHNKSYCQIYEQALHSSTICAYLYTPYSVNNTYSFAILKNSNHQMLTYFFPNWKVEKMMSQVFKKT